MKCTGKIFVMKLTALVMDCVYLISPVSSISLRMKYYFTSENMLLLPWIPHVACCYLKFYQFMFKF